MGEAENTEIKDNYVTVKVPKELAGEIDTIIESGTLGYRSRAELVNDAIRHIVEPNLPKMKISPTHKVL